VGLPWSRRSTRLYGSDGSIERAGAGMNMLRTPRHVAPPSRPEGTLGSYFSPLLTPEVRQVAAAEGWILGVV